VEAYTMRDSLRGYRRLHSYDDVGHSTTMQMLCNGADGNSCATVEHDALGRLAR
jgi:hypothetical protein